MDLYSILTEIHHTKIQYAHTQPHSSITELIAASQQNLAHFQMEQRLNMAYATIKSKLRSGKQQSINQVITGAFSDFELELDQSLSFKSIYQLMSIAFSAAHLQSDFHQIESFMEHLHNIVSQKVGTEEKYLFYQIEIEHLLASTHFRNRNFETSMDFLKQMETLMLKNNRFYFNRFNEKFVLLKALNLNYTGNPNEAISLLNAYGSESLDVVLTKIMCHFQQSDYSDAYQIVKELSHSDRWYEKKAGWIWVLKKNIIEILLLIELNRLELVLVRMRSFERRFFKRLSEENETRVIKFMKLVSYAYEFPEKIQTPNFNEKVQASFTWKEASQEDVFVMSFYAWLKSKMENRPLYETTLQLVGMR